MKHTPGPWTEHHNLIEGADGRNIIAIIQYTESGYVRANAALIAAAPTMYDTLREAWNWFNDVHKDDKDVPLWVKEAYQIIKAEPEGKEE